MLVRYWYFYGVFFLSFLLQNRYWLVKIKWLQKVCWKLWISCQLLTCCSFCLVLFEICAFISIFVFGKLKSLTHAVFTLEVACVKLRRHRLWCVYGSPVYSWFLFHNKVFSQKRSPSGKKTVATLQEKVANIGDVKVVAPTLLLSE